MGALFNHMFWCNHCMLFFIPLEDILQNQVIIVQTIRNMFLQTYLLFVYHTISTYTRICGNKYYNIIFKLGPYLLVSTYSERAWLIVHIPHSNDKLLARVQGVWCLNSLINRVSKLMQSLVIVIFIISIYFILQAFYNLIYI